MIGIRLAKIFQRYKLVAGRIRPGLDHELRFGTVADDALSFIFKRGHFNTNKLGRSWVSGASVYPVQDTNKVNRIKKRVGHSILMSTL